MNTAYPCESWTGDEEYFMTCCRERVPYADKFCPNCGSQVDVFKPVYRYETYLAIQFRWTLTHECGSVLRVFESRMRLLRFKKRTKLMPGLTYQFREVATIQKRKKRW